MFRSFLLLALFGVTASSALANLHRTQMESDVLASAIGVSSEWTRGRRVVSQDTIVLVAALAEDEAALADLEAVVLARSDPANPDYALPHLTRDEVVARTSPPARSVKEATNFFTQGGASLVQVGGHGNLLRITMSAAKAEVLLQTQLHHFTNNHRRSLSVIRAISPYSLPSSIASVITFIDGLLRLPQIPLSVHPETSAPETPAADCLATDCSANCCEKVTPAVLKTRYGIPDAVAGNAEASTLAVAEFQGEKWDQKDLTKFADACHLPNLTVANSIPADAEGNICSVPIFGAGACTESMLDVEYAKAVSPGIALSDVYSESYSILDWALTVGNLTNPPLVHSISYGNDEKQQTSRAYAFTTSNEFLKLTGRGMTVIAASGDAGPCGREGCSPVFHVGFPASSPFVTAVGGTNFATKNVIGDETAWNNGGSGFSNFFTRPSWQATAVQKYINLAGDSLPPQAKWNATGRAMPDVAALAGGVNPYCVAVGSLQGISVYGTSAASPVFASTVARLNAVRLGQTNGKSMGFMNPWIYANPQAFHDVTTGKSDGGTKDGFPATTGWDAATGYGTPNYPEMVKAL